MDRRTFLALLGTGILVGEVRAEQGTSHRIGALNFRSLRPILMEILINALRKQGYVNGENLSIEFRFGDPDEFPALAKELVHLDLKLITCGSSAPVRALMAATRTIPIVAIDLETDPVASGFASNLARPGGNLTGFFFDLPQFSAKRLEVLRETLPGIKRVVAIWDPALDRAPVSSLESASSAIGVTLVLRPVENKEALVGAFKGASQIKAGAVMVMQSPRLDAMRAEILQLAARHRIPVAALFTNFAADGALLSYGPDVDEMTTRMAVYVDKVLKGARPGDLPIQRPERFEFALNARAAKQLGIAIPRSILARADTVIQ